MKVTPKRKFFVGLFVFTGLLLALLVFLWLGVTSFLAKGNHYVTYFDQSVQGLAVDSPVKFRGVTIGRVTEMKVAPDARLIEVVMLINTNQRITRRMFAQLNVVGITGVMFVEIDLAKGRPPQPPVLEFKPPYPVIPSRL